MDANSLFNPGKYLKTNDVDAAGGQLELTIASVSREEYKDATTGKVTVRGLLSFFEISQQFSTNTTNTRTLVDMFGERDVDKNWVGQKITLVIDDHVKFAGREVRGIRILQTDPRQMSIAAYWQLVSELGLDRMEGLRIVRESENDFDKARLRLRLENGLGAEEKHAPARPVPVAPAQPAQRPATATAAHPTPAGNGGKPLHPTVEYWQLARKLGWKDDDTKALLAKHGGVFVNALAELKSGSATPPQQTATSTPVMSIEERAGILLDIESMSVKLDNYSMERGATALQLSLMSDDDLRAYQRNTLAVWRELEDVPF